MVHQIENCTEPNILFYILIMGRILHSLFGSKCQCVRPRTVVIKMSSVRGGKGGKGERGGMGVGDGWE